MSDLTRAEMIEELTEHLNHWKRLLKEGICGKEQGERTIKSLEFAIDSLKVDEAYNLMYEKVDFIVIPEGATNGDMIKAMFPDAEITMPRNPLNTNSCVIVNYNYNEKHYNYYRLDWWNSPYRKEQR